MTPETKEWAAKAEGDFSVAWAVYRMRKSRNDDAACFHCQQCVEKYLKARLTEANTPFAKTHDCVGLLAMVLRFEPLWSGFEPACTRLNPFAVRFRYPGMNATKEQAKQALVDCGVMREAVRLSLDLPAAKQPKLARRRKSR